MSPYRRRSSSFHRSRPRRKTLWATRSSVGNLVTASALSVPLDLLFPLETAGVGVVGGTILRSHIWFSLTGSDTDTNPGVTTGLVMYDKSATAAGTPNPTTDFFIPWMQLRVLSPGTCPNTVASPPNAPTQYLYGMDYDIKSRRRIPNMGVSLFWCVANSGSQSVNWNLFSRILIALP